MQPTRSPTLVGPAESGGARRRRAGFRVGYARGGSEDVDQGAGAGSLGAGVTPLTGRGSIDRRGSVQLDEADFSTMAHPGESLPSVSQPQSVKHAHSVRGTSFEVSPQTATAQPIIGTALRSAITSPDSASASLQLDAAHLRASPADGVTAVRAVSAMGHPPKTSAATAIASPAAANPPRKVSPSSSRVVSDDRPLPRYEQGRGGMASQSAFDDTMGFMSEVEAAPASLFESGLQGHSLSEQTAMVKQRLEMEQERLAKGALFEADF